MPGAYPEDQMVKATSSLGWDHPCTNLYFVGHILAWHMPLRLTISLLILPRHRANILILAPGAPSRNDSRTIRNANAFLLSLLLFWRLM